MNIFSKLGIGLILFNLVLGGAAVSRSLFAFKKMEGEVLRETSLFNSGKDYSGSIGPFDLSKKNIALSDKNFGSVFGIENKDKKQVAETGQKKGKRSSKGKSQKKYTIYGTAVIDSEPVVFSSHIPKGEKYAYHRSGDVLNSMPIRRIEPGKIIMGENEEKVVQMFRSDTDKYEVTRIEKDKDVQSK